MNKLILIIGLFIIVVGGLFFLLTSEQDDVYTESAAFNEDTTIEGNYTVEEGQKIVVKNGSTLTINGDLNVKGAVACERGPLNIVVKGDLVVDDMVECNLEEEIAESDIGTGISFVVEGSITFNENAIVVSNGHVQIVDNPDNLARTQEEIDRIYAEVIEDTGDIPRIGPFVPESGEVGLANPAPQTFVVQASADRKVSRILHGALFQEVYAQGDIPDVPRDEEGDPVRTVQFSGKWYVGNPRQDPPRELHIPTPPKKIKKVIILFNFGPGKQVNLTNFTLTGPNGRDGEDSVEESCNARGEDGKDAMRFRVRASNIKVNNFFLFPGDGGSGGQAITKRKCDHGKANGGDGGNAGNVKMEASGTFIVEGTFQLWPGWGGDGGRAIAYGKDGEKGCPGEDGGDATATGGKGGDNKKRLRIANVQGVGNIQIGILFAGSGGAAKARPGKGGEGTGCKCNGGKGGEGIATGGTGGDGELKLAGGVARTPGADENGGDGGDADARGGDGGKGGTCDPTDAGGDGGDGGDATPKAGTGGTATNPGNDGNDAEQGGNGGDGGDGCPEGKGGTGGIGNTLGNDGADGKDGKNICPVAPPPPPPGTTLPPPPPVTINPPQIEKIHIIGESSCPDPLPSISISGPEGNSWQVDAGTVPAWLSIPEAGTIPTEMVSLSFTCEISDFTSHTESAKIKLQTFDSNNQPTGDSFFDVFVEVVAR